MLNSKVNSYTLGLGILICVLMMGMTVFVSGANDKLAEEQVFRLSVDATDLGNADPHVGTGTHHRILYDLLFNGLVRYAPGEYPKIEPDLAKAIPEPEMRNGEQVWTFNLREGVMTHSFPGYPNGYEITAEDIVYSFNRAKDPDRSTYSDSYAGWEFEAVDTYTVSISPPEPLSKALFLPLVADYMGGMIVPKKAEQELGYEKYRMNPIGTGPFFFDNYRPMERIVLKGHENYFRGEPVLDEVHLRYIGDISAAEMGVRAGELEAALGPMEQPWVEKMEGYPGVTVDVYGPGENVTLHYNMSKSPLDKLKVRRAISYALSRKQMVGLFGEDIAVPTYSQVPYGYLPGGLSREMIEEAGYSWMLGTELSKAKTLLEEAGFPDGFTLESYASEREYYRRPYELVKEQLRKIGINLKLTVVDHATYHSQIRENTNDLTFYNAWRPSADIYLTRFFYSASRVVVGEKPDTNFSHTDMVDDLIESAREEMDAEKQEELWRETQLTLAEHTVYMPFCLLQLVTARRENVDWGHPVESSATLYPQITENTKLLEE